MGSEGLDVPAHVDSPTTAFASRLQKYMEIEGKSDDNFYFQLGEIC